MSVVLKKLSLSDCSPAGIARIIKDKQLTNNLNYKAFLYLVKSSATNEDKTEFLQIVKNLTIVVALFDMYCEDVFNEVVAVSWEIESEAFKETVKQFLIALMSSQPFYTNRIIDRVIQNLAVFHPSNKEPLIHQTNLEILTFVTDNMPTYIKFVQQKLKSNFPHKSKPLPGQRSYIANIFKFSELIPSYFTDVVFTVIEKLVKIDMDISKSSHIECNGLFSFDEDRPNESIDDEVCDKLDMLLTDLLGYMTTNSNDDLKVSLWCKALLLSFDSHILKAHNPPNVPFVIFYFFNIHPTLKTVLLDYFWSVFVDKNQPAIIRQSGIVYLASFTNRAKCVQENAYKKVILTVANWCQSYIENNDEISAKCNHTAFYAACQSLFYMFCYRHQEIINSSGHKEFLVKINFHLIVNSKLNPLRHCAAPILRMFNKLTSLYEVVMCSVIIERNLRMLLPTSQRYDYGDYPFQSCTLELSSKVIIPYCREMECLSNLVSDGRTYKLSENFEDWDHVIGDTTGPLSPEFSTMSISQ